MRNLRPLRARSGRARRGRRPDPARRGSSGAPTPAPGATSSARRNASSRRARSPRSAGRTRPATRPRASPPQIAGLVCAAQIAQANGATDDAAHYRVDRRRLAPAPRPLDRDHQRAAVDVARTSCGSARTATPTRARPTRSPTAVRPSTSARSWTRASWSSSASASCAPTTPTCVSSLPVVDRELGVDTPNGRVLAPLQPRRLRRDRRRPAVRDQRRHRAPVADLRGRARRVRARRGAAAGRPRGRPRGRDDTPRRHRQHRQRRARCSPSRCGTTTRRPAPTAATPGTGTGSATPLGWTHAQFIRLAWSIDAGRPVERPEPRQLPLRRSVLRPLSRSSSSAASDLRSSPRPIPRQHGGRLGELDVAVVDDLDVVAPRVAEIAAPPELATGYAGLARARRARPPCRRRRARSGGHRRAAGSGRLLSAMNWSPMSMKAMVRRRPRSSNSKKRDRTTRAPRRCLRPRARRD